MIKFRLFVAFCLLWPCLSQAQPTSMVARSGEFAVKQLVSPGFENLPLERRLFAFYFVQAIEAEYDIDLVPSE